MRTKDNRGKIMMETSVITEDNWTKLCYHNTVVAKYRPTKFLDPKDVRCGTLVELNTGGYFTVTTKKRMNQFARMFDLPFRVWQEKGEWFVDIHDKDYKTLDKFQFDGNSCSFTITT